MWHASNEHTSQRSCRQNFADVDKSSKDHNSFYCPFGLSRTDWVWSKPIQSFFKIKIIYIILNKKVFFGQEVEIIFEDKTFI